MNDDEMMMTPTANDTTDGGVDDDATLPILVSLWARLSDSSVPYPMPDSF
ncbi:MAG: hypothetical protein WBG66_10040 [Geitlerinemataceae cyanobacterium]